ncbi:hypothetical protein BC351_10705 [Paenibacillus ferrarius]|uniref:Uncharacterized protein n=1 Tax=Paenibacillus ferrarius TaxID=1469647 RepID=A0A1V4H917_9BACL|nr:hypothetical protein BC351_10705 [Paenibacillus ferrarius]
MTNQLTVFQGQEVMILTKEDVNVDFKGDFLIRAKDVGIVLEYETSNATKEVLKFCKKDQILTLKNSNISLSVKSTYRKLNNTGEAFITNLALNRVFGKSENHSKIGFMRKLCHLFKRQVDMSVMTICSLIHTFRKLMKLQNYCSSKLLAQ